MKNGRVLKDVTLKDKGDTFEAKTSSGLTITIKKEEIEKIVKAGEGEK